MLEGISYRYSLAIAVVLCASLGCGAVDTKDPSSGDAGASATGGASASASASPGQTEQRTDLFYKTFGDSSKRVVVYLHGGPGGNAYMFEALGAQRLADRGNFVVCYDQRGAGRSPPGSPQDFTYQRATQDLDDLIHALKLKDPILFGISWGGTLAVKYLELHPGVAKGAILTSNPVDYAASLYNVHARTEKIYRDRWDFAKADAVAQLRARMFPNGLVPPYDYSADDAFTTLHNAMDCGLYMPDVPSLETIGMYLQLAFDPNANLLTAENEEVAKAFHRNEHTLSSDFSEQFAKLRPGLFGIYGAEDGLFDDAQRGRIASLLSPGHFTIVEDASHAVPMDQPEVFLDLISRYLDELSH